MTKTDPVFAPREVFEQTLQYFVIPTFDLVIDVPGEGIVMVRRTIAPYANKWALPGLRMYKNESIDDTLKRIAQQEVGLAIDVSTKQLLGQFVGKFKTENDRQDLSTGYVVKATRSNIVINDAHFSGYRFVNSEADIPTDVGAMYSFYLQKYFTTR